MGQANPWLIYALGGGWGHLNRAVALGRVAAAAEPVQILTNSPYAAAVAQVLQNWQAQGQAVPALIRFPATLDKTALCRQVRAVLLTCELACLVVDTFPRGLGGELADLLPKLSGYPKVLVHRAIQPGYVRSHRLTDFVAQHYDQIIIPGEGPDLSLAPLPQVCHTPPWLVLNREELPADDLLTAAPILVCAAGNPSEQALFGGLVAELMRAFPQVAVRCLASACPPGCPPDHWLSTWPGLPWIAQASVVVGSGGYNTVYECAALQTPLVAFALPRLYDDQAKRLRRYGRQVGTVTEAVAAVGQVLSEFGGRSRFGLPAYENGALAAHRLIASCKIPPKAFVDPVARRKSWP